jgi:hypothetical protein
VLAREVGDAPLIGTPVANVNPVLDGAKVPSGAATEYVKDA